MSVNAVETFVGVDVSKNTLDVRIEPDNANLHVAYDEARIKTVGKRLVEAAPTLIVMEATGGVGGDDLPKNFGGINWWRNLASRKAKRRGRAGP